MSRKTYLTAFRIVCTGGLDRHAIVASSIPRSLYNTSFAAVDAVLVAAYCKGKSGKRYPYYYCRQRGCSAVSVPKQKMEVEFTDMLGRLIPRKEVVSKFSRIAARVWETRQGNAERYTKMLNAKLDDLQSLKSELLKSKLRGQVTQEDYEEANINFTREIAEVEKELRKATYAQADTDSYIRFAEMQLLDIKEAWRIASPDQRCRVRQLLFSDGLRYSKKSGLSNTTNQNLYSVLETMASGSVILATPEGVEPPTLSSED